MMQKNSFSLPHHLSALSATFEISLNANYSGFRADLSEIFLYLCDNLKLADKVFPYILWIFIVRIRIFAR